MIQCAFYLAPDGKLLDQPDMEQIKDFLAAGRDCFGLIWKMLRKEARLWKRLPGLF